MYRVVLSFLLCAAASAFFLSTSRVSVRPSSSALFGDLFPNGGCPEKLMDGNGRCPGQSGFTPQPFKVEAQYKVRGIGQRISFKS